MVAKSRKSHHGVPFVIFPLKQMEVRLGFPSFPNLVGEFATCGKARFCPLRGFPIMMEQRESADPPLDWLNKWPPKWHLGWEAKKNSNTCVAPAVQC